MYSTLKTSNQLDGKHTLVTLKGSQCVLPSISQLIN